MQKSRSISAKDTGNRSTDPKRRGTKQKEKSEGLQLFVQYKGLEELSYDVLHELIEVIYFYDPEHIEIVWKYRDEFLEVTG